MRIDRAWLKRTFLAIALGALGGAFFGPIYAIGDTLRPARGPAGQGHYFQVQREFPNYFLPAEWRSVPPETVPDAVVNESLSRLEATLQSIFRRLELPVVVDGQIKQVRYFSYLTAQLREIDPSAQVVPSGGVVRSAISYIYSELLLSAEQSPHVSSAQVMERMCADSSPLPGWKIRGTASDFDVLLYRFHAQHMNQLIGLAANLTNSAESQTGATEVHSSSKRLFYTIADFKPYPDQLRRSTVQGGSTLDFLAFDIDSGRLIAPKDSQKRSYQGIALDLVRGFYRYLPPEQGTPDQPDKQTIRGLRGLLELPFLSIQDDTQLREEIDQIIKELVNGRDLTEKAYEQFTKAVRNARFSGANNRIYRGRPGSIEEKIFQLVKAIPRNARGGGYSKLPALPEMVDRLPLGRKSDVPPELLMPMEAFRALYTNEGVLYHGTPDMEKASAILRGGIFVSGGALNQGNAVFGRGGYTSQLRGVAEEYAGINGVVLKMDLRNDPRIRILLWDKAHDHPWIRELEKNHPNQDIFALLAREHGVDIVVNNHVLLQNVLAVQFPTDLYSFLKASASSLTGAFKRAEATSLDLDTSLKNLVSYQILRAGFSQMYGSELPSVLAILQESDMKRFGAALANHLDAIGSLLTPEDFETFSSDQRKKLCDGLIENAESYNLTPVAAWIRTHAFHDVDPAQWRQLLIKAIKSELGRLASARHFRWSPPIYLRENERFLVQEAQNAELYELAAQLIDWLPDKAFDTYGNRSRARKVLDYCAGKTSAFPESVYAERSSITDGTRRQAVKILIKRNPNSWDALYLVFYSNLSWIEPRDKIPLLVSDRVKEQPRLALRVLEEIKDVKLDREEISTLVSVIKGKRSWSYLSKYALDVLLAPSNWSSETALSLVQSLDEISYRDRIRILSHLLVLKDGISPELKMALSRLGSIDRGLIKMTWPTSDCQALLQAKRH